MTETPSTTAPYTNPALATLILANLILRTLLPGYLFDRSIPISWMAETLYNIITNPSYGLGLQGHLGGTTSHFLWSINFEPSPATLGAAAFVKILNDTLVAMRNT